MKLRLPNKKKLEDLIKVSPCCGFEIVNEYMKDS